MKSFAILFASLFMLLGCEDQGPMERAGEELDEAAEDIRAGGETLPNRLDDAADQVREAGEDVADELQR